MKPIIIYLGLMAVIQSAHAKQKLIEIVVSGLGSSDLYLESEYNSPSSSGDDLPYSIKHFNYINDNFNENRTFYPTDGEIVLMSGADTGNFVKSDVFKMKFETPSYNRLQRVTSYPFALKFRSNLVTARVFRRINAEVIRNDRGSQWWASYRGVLFNKLHIKLTITGKITRLTFYKDSRFVSQVQVDKLPKIPESYF